MSTQHARTALATGTCLTLGLAVAVAVGAVPRVAATDQPAPVVAAAPQTGLDHLLLHPVHLAKVHSAVSHARRTAHVAHSNAASSTAPAAATPSVLNDVVSSITVNPAGAAAAPAEVTNIKQAAPHHKKKGHHKKKHHHHKPAKPKKAPRTTPSASAISNAISGLRNYVHTPLTPSSAQVAQFGDAVCTAFDQNKTFTQVKAQILAQVQKLPFTTVSAGAADFVVKTAVSLYCPGYKSKVS